MGLDLEVIPISQQVSSNCCCRIAPRNLEQMYICIVGLRGLQYIPIMRVQSPRSPKRFLVLGVQGLGFTVRGQQLLLEEKNHIVAKLSIYQFKPTEAKPLKRPSSSSAQQPESKQKKAAEPCEQSCEFCGGRCGRYKTGHVTHTCTRCAVKWALNRYY